MRAVVYTKTIRNGADKLLFDCDDMEMRDGFFVFSDLKESKSSSINENGDTITHIEYKPVPQAFVAADEVCWIEVEEENNEESNDS